jgi:hypothetical protein
MSIPDLVDCMESTGRLPALQSAVCEGGQSLCELLADPALDVAAAVDCIPNGNIPEWTNVIIGQPEATPEVIVAAIDGAGKSGPVAAILCPSCPPCDDATYQLQDTALNPIGAPGTIASGGNANITAPDATVNTTNGLTFVQSIRSNASGNLPQSVIKYKDANDDPQETTASDTEFASSTLRPATEIPRRSINYVGGSPTGVFADAGALIADTLPEVPIPPHPANVLREYITSSVWTHPSGLRELVVVAVGAGGGGAGGRRSSSNSVGGPAGGGGAYVIRRIPASLLGSVGSTQTVTVGTGGAGGAASTGASNPGSAGGDSSFGSLVVAKGGQGGAAALGTGSLTPGGSPATCTPARGPYALAGGAAPVGVSNTTTPTSPGMDGSRAAPGGGVGGGHTTTPAEGPGSDGGGVYEDGTLHVGPAGGAVPGGNGGNGVDDLSQILLLEFGVVATYGIGTGGAGGAGSRTSGVNGGNGGNGGRCAGGGGGGSVNTIPASAGAGGDGGDGLIQLIEIY